MTSEDLGPLRAGRRVVPSTFATSWHGEGLPDAILGVDLGPSRSCCAASLWEKGDSSRPGLSRVGVAALCTLPAVLCQLLCSPLRKMRCRGGESGAARGRPDWLRIASGLPASLPATLPAALRASDRGGRLPGAAPATCRKALHIRCTSHTVVMGLDLLQPR